VATSILAGGHDLGTVGLEVGLIARLRDLCEDLDLLDLGFLLPHVEAGRVKLHVSKESPSQVLKHLLNLVSVHNTVSKEVFKAILKLLVPGRHRGHNALAVRFENRQRVPKDVQNYRDLAIICNFEGLADEHKSLYEEGGDILELVCFVTAFIFVPGGQILACVLLIVLNVGLNEFLTGTVRVSRVPERGHIVRFDHKHGVIEGQLVGGGGRGITCGMNRGLAGEDLGPGVHGGAVST
jgi:hypothetical protein